MPTASATTAREHQGRIILPIEVDETALAVALVDAGLIEIADQDDPQKLAVGLQRLIEIVLTGDLSVATSRVTTSNP